MNYPKGIYFDKPRDNAPDFVIGRISIKKEALLEWLNETPANEKGYINLEVLNGRENKPYIRINDYKSKKDPF